MHLIPEEGCSGWHGHCGASPFLCSCGTVSFLLKTFFAPASLLCFPLCRALAMLDCYNNGPWKVMPSFIRCPLNITLPCLWSRGTLFPYFFLRTIFMCLCVDLSGCIYVHHVCAGRVQKRVSGPLELELRWLWAVWCVRHLTPGWLQEQCAFFTAEPRSSPFSASLVCDSLWLSFY